jgi:predicted chitinase
MITAAQFRSIFPNCPSSKREVYLPLLVAAMREAKITTRKRAAAFLAQLGHESLDFKYMEEIASGAAYEGRKDLGNLRAGDGRRFKGRGPIQITGRLNYTSCGIALGLKLDTDPELLNLPENAFRASAWFWSYNKLNIYADALTGIVEHDGTLGLREATCFDKITRRINGGYNGRDERRARYVRALRALTDAQFAAPALPVPAVLDAVAAASPANALTGTPAQTAPLSADTAEQVSTPAEQDAASLLDEIPVTDETKAVAGSILKRLGVRLGGGIATLWASGIHGHLLVIVGLAGAVLLVYFERKRLVPAVRKVLGKVFAK